MPPAKRTAKKTTQRKRVVYTDTQRAEAQALYEEHGPTRAATETSIPKGTIAAWARRHGWQTVCTDATRARVEAWKAVTSEQRQEAAAAALEAAAETLSEINGVVEQTKVTEHGDVVHYEAKHSPRNRYYLAKTYEVLVKSSQLLAGQATERPVFTDDQEVQAVAADVLRLIPGGRSEAAG